VADSLPRNCPATLGYKPVARHGSFFDSILLITVQQHLPQFFSPQDVVFLPAFILWKADKIRQFTFRKKIVHKKIETFFISQKMFFNIALEIRFPVLTNPLYPSVLRGIFFWGHAAWFLQVMLHAVDCLVLLSKALGSYYQCVPIILPAFFYNAYIYPHEAKAYFLGKAWRKRGQSRQASLCIKAGL
jgi:hypothetical protein